MYRFSFEMESAAKMIENAIESVLNKGYRSADIFTGSTREKQVSTREMGYYMVETLE